MFGKRTSTLPRAAGVAWMVLCGTVGLASAAESGYPRLIGMNIGDPQAYDDPDYQAKLARLDIVILGFYPRWKEWKYGPRGPRDVVRALKRRNPTLRIGQYTNLNEAKLAGDPNNAQTDLSQKLDRSAWWLLTADGRRVQWTDRYGNFDVNISTWVEADGAGLRYPQWYAERNERVFFGPIPEITIWYLDNSLSAPPAKVADWNRDGTNDSADDADIAAEYRRGHRAYWIHILQRRPGALLLANADDVSLPEYSGILHGVFMEALIGRWWSVEGRRGWDAMMLRYRSAMANTRQPRLVGFGVVGAADDYQRLRYGLSSCLLDDGFFSYSIDGPSAAYQGVAWFDEYDVDLGMPVDPPVTAPAAGGVYQRRFERGMVLVNPASTPKRFDVPPGYRRIRGVQDPVTNNGKPVTDGWLSAKEGLILVRDNVDRGR